MSPSLAQRAAEYQRLVEEARQLAEEQAAGEHHTAPDVLDAHLQRLRDRIAAPSARVAIPPAAESGD